MNAEMISRLLVASTLARQVVEDLLSGNVAWTVTKQSPASSSLWCRACGTTTWATYALGTWVEFDKQLRAGTLQCQCGGVLAQAGSVILTP